MRKEVSISLLMALLTQGALAVWWVSDFNSWRQQTDHHIEKIDGELEETTHRAEAMDREVTDRLGRIETMLTNIERRLDQRGMR